MYHSKLCDFILLWAQAWSVALCASLQVFSTSSSRGTWE